MFNISAIIITKNEEKRIANCLKSLNWVDEIIVVDSFSTDRTCEICNRYTNRVYQRLFDNFQNQKNYALEMARGKWVLSVDADEIIGGKLKDEILKTTKNPGSYKGFLVPRENYLFNMPVRHTWGSFLFLRLFMKEKGTFSGSVHEKVVVDGTVGRLQNPFYHYNSDDLQEFIAKNNLYTTLEAKRKFESGEKFNVLKTFGSPFKVFLFRFISLRGYKDGAIGLVLSIFLAIFTLFIHLKLWQLEQNSPSGH